MSVPVADLDAASVFYTDVLGCEVVFDGEAMPGARVIEVVPPGSGVTLLLLPPDSPVPVAIRLGTDDADAAYRRLAEVDGVTHHNDDVLRWPGVPPMFHVSDPQGTSLVLLQDDEAR
ncbi:VOC family protein [Actinotalea sp. AC32]|nr:VOC family protein [Actinotalea sp. AC32]